MLQKDSAGRVGVGSIRKQTKFANNPEIAAMALADLLGRKLPDVMHFLKEHVGDLELEDQDEENSDF